MCGGGIGGSIFPPFSPRDYEQGPRRNDVVIAAPPANLLLREGCVYASPAERNSKHKSCYRLVGSNKHTTELHKAGNKGQPPQSDILATLRAADASVDPCPFDSSERKGERNSKLHRDSGFLSKNANLMKMV